MKVYVVTAGEYSDYHIAAVYSTKEKAELYAAVLEGYVEEYETDEPVVEGKVYYGVEAELFAEFDAKGVSDINKARLMCATPFRVLEKVEPKVTRSIADYFRNYNPGCCWKVIIPTSKYLETDEGRTKVVSDFWAKYKAEISEDKA